MKILDAHERQNNVRRKKHTKQNKKILKHLNFEFKAWQQKDYLC